MMALEPNVFMFDEPTAGMSIDEVPVVLDLIAQLKQDTSKIILLVEHKMDVVRSLADRIIVLHNGKLVADGKPAEVIASPMVQEAYLGIVGREEPHERAAHASPASRPISGAITSCTASISTCREGRTTMLLGRNGAGKTTTLRTIMGLWRASRRRDPPRRRAHRGARHAGYRARRHRLCAGDHGGVLRPDGEGKPGAGGARRRRSTRHGSTGFSASSRP